MQTVWAKKWPGYCIFTEKTLTVDMNAILPNRITLCCFSRPHRPPSMSHDFCLCVGDKDWTTGSHCVFWSNPTRIRIRDSLALCSTGKQKHHHQQNWTEGPVSACLQGSSTSYMKKKLVIITLTHLHQQLHTHTNLIKSDTTKPCCWFSLSTLELSSVLKPGLKPHTDYAVLLCNSWSCPWCWIPVWTDKEHTPFFQTIAVAVCGAEPWF